MTDRTMNDAFDAFDQVLAAEFERMVAGAFDPTPAADIADAAMRPRSVVGRARTSPTARRLLLLGIAAVLLVPAAYLGATRFLPRQDDSTLPKPSLLAVAPTAAPTTRPNPSIDEWRAILVGRMPGTTDGISIYAVREDGAERLLRDVPASLLPIGHLFSLDYAAVSASGLVALADQLQPWNVVVIDLRDPASEPWIVPGSSAGGTGPKWGPRGLLAVHAAGGVIIADPATRTVLRQLSGGEIGGGPTIVWTKDGSGIIDQLENGTFGVLPIDGRPFEPGFPDIFGNPGGYADGGATLRICSAGGGECLVEDGHVELVTQDGKATTIYEQRGTDRVAGAVFGTRPGEYFLNVQTDAGRRIAVVRVSGDSVESVAAMQRPQNWNYNFLASIAPDASLTVFSADLGDQDFGTAILPSGPDQPSFHSSRFAGYLSSAIADTVGGSNYAGTDAHPLGPAAATPYPYQSVDSLIAAEVKMNSSHFVVGQASHDAVLGDSEIEQYPLTASAGPDLDVYVDCFGAHELTFSFKGQVLTNPCLGPGSWVWVYPMKKGDTATISASHDTTWRVVLYGTAAPGAGATPAPLAEPATP